MCRLGHSIRGNIPGIVSCQELSTMSWVPAEIAALSMAALGISSRSCAVNDMHRLPWRCSEFQESGNMSFTRVAGSPRGRAANKAMLNGKGDHDQEWQRCFSRHRRTDLRLKFPPIRDSSKVSYPRIPTLVPGVLRLCVTTPAASEIRAPTTVATS